MNTPKHPPAAPNRREALLALLGTALLPACGGGTDMAGLSSGGTGSFTTGSIVGLGSVIVNGIRYDDSTARISLDGGASSAAALKLGMVVRIQGSPVKAATMPGGLPTATASSIVCDSEWKGHVSAPDTTARCFRLLGQTVHVPTNAVFTGGAFDGGLAGQYAEVYGFLNTADGSLQATRVEIRSTPFERYRLSGVVKNLDTTTTFTLGSATINYASASGASGLKNGQLVRVDLQPTGKPNGQWVATAVRIDNYRSELEDDDEAELEGSITAFTSPASFSVNGIPVDASAITSPPAGLALGVRVEVKGSVRNGVVIATKIKVKTEEEVEAQEYEFHGTVSAIDTTAKSFVVRGYTVYYDAQTDFSLHGMTWDANLSVSVEVKAVLDPSTGHLVATKVETGG